jgi:DNA uptake protein ComE-like DNA-binding protein
MKNFLSDFFYFNKRERRGIYFLFFLITLVSISNLVIPLLIPKTELNLERYNSIIAQYDSLLNSEAEQDTIKLFKFDPNKLPLDAWLKLGLNEKQAQVILNYLNKGGYFKEKEDLRNIYSISEEFYSKLEPFIQISTKTKNLKNEHLQIELNSTDSSELIKISGIGPVFASRIIKYRNLLGGYISVNQLQEVYGIDSTKFISIRNDFATCNLELIKKININQADFKELLKHPYISYDFTKHIVNLRKKEAFSKAEDAFNIQFISDSTFKKLLPYLSTN